MIPFFTDPYNDELIYSAIARYHFYSGTIDVKDTLEELFQSRSVVPSLEIGSRFSILAENMGPNYTVEGLLAKNTIYPYYASFLSKQRQKEIFIDVKEKGSGLYDRLGMVAGGICRKVGLYYCPKCAANDMDSYGEPYIHREHQLQGIYYCAHHKLRLKKYAIDSLMVSRFEYIRFDENLIELSNLQDEENVFFKEVQIKLAEMAYQLFQIPHNMFSREDINLKYKALLRKLGFVTLRGTVRQKELNKAFQAKFPEGFLEKSDSGVEKKADYNWLSRISHNSVRHTHPFRHLLMIYFLDQDVESFMKVEPDYGPFGKGPWPCLNKMASHYKQNVINEVKLKRSHVSKNPMGEFICSCGFVYNRTGPDVQGDKKYCIEYVSRYGDNWREDVYKLTEEGFSLKKIAEKIGGNPNSLRQKLLQPIEINDLNVKTNDLNVKTNDNKVEQYRTVIIEAMKKSPDFSRTELSRNFRTAYIFLSKNDKEWMNINLPTTRRHVNKGRVDWEKRDQEYYKKIKEVYNELLSLNKPVRITNSLIGRKLNKLTVLTSKEHLIKLPRTNELLNKITESVQDFQIRRCCKIIDDLFEEKQPVFISTVRSRGGLRSDSYFEIKPILEKYIHMKEIELKNCKHKN